MRLSEALTILPFFTSMAIPGLTIGCLITNIITGCLPYDIIFGTIATLIGSIFSYHFSNLFKHNKTAILLTPLFPILSNTIIIPLILSNVYMFKGSLSYFVLTVFIGEFISCFVLGEILLNALIKRQELFD